MNIKRTLLCLLTCILLVLCLVSCDTDPCANGHTEVVDSAIAPTCSTPGLTEGTHCSVCGEVIIAQKTVPALGHTWDEGVVTQAPTCTEAGSKSHHCTACEEKTDSTEVPATGHVATSEWVVITKATYESEGQEALLCKNCHKILETRVIPKLEVPAIVKSVDGATVNADDFTIMMYVDSSTEHVDLTQKVLCSTGSTWKLFSDHLKRYEIPTKIAADYNEGKLLDGANIFYVLVTASTGEQNTYELTIYRSYQVGIYYYDGATLLKTDYVYTNTTYSSDYQPEKELPLKKVLQAIRHLPHNGLSSIIPFLTF